LVAEKTYLGGDTVCAQAELKQCPIMVGKKALPTLHLNAAHMWFMVTIYEESTIDTKSKTHLPPTARSLRRFVLPFPKQ